MPEDDPRRDDVYEIAFALQREDPSNEDTPVMWPFGNGWEPGWSIDLPDGSGYVACVIIEDAHSGEALAALLHLIWY